MANRFSQTTTAGFKGLSLDEIMAIPLAKQAQQDASLAATDELQELQAKRLEGDAGIVDEELERIRKESEQISTDLMEKGVDRNLANKLRALRSSQRKSFGASGVVGQAQANYEAAQKYINELATKKELQAGWSPQEAKEWAVRQVKDFGSSFDELGNFRQFQGKGLATKVDEDKFLREAIDDIEEQVSPISFQAIKIGGLPSFTKAFQEGKISSKDYNTIVAHLSNMSMNSPELMASLRQQAEFTGEEDFADFGGFEEKIVKDKNGKNVKIKEWNVGKSRFGRKIAGLAGVSAYSNIEIDTKLIEDKVAYKLWEKNMEKQEALELVVFNKGEANQITEDTLESVEKNIELYGSEVNSFYNEMKNFKSKLKAQGASEEEITNNREYQRLKSNYNKSNTNYRNSKQRLDEINKKVEGQLSKDDKLTKSVVEEIEHYGSAVEALKQLYGTKVDLTKTPPLTSDINAYEEEQAANLLYNKKGGKQSWWAKKGFEQAKFDFNSNRRKKIKTYLESNPTAEYFTRLNAETTGKHATKIGRYNKLRSENFDPNSSQLAYGKGLFNDSKEIAELGESAKGFSYQVEATDGTDDHGNHFDNVIVTNNETGKSTSVQVINNLNNEAYSQISSDLLAGSPAQQKMGRQILADRSHMRDIKQSGLTWKDEGSIYVPKVSDQNGNKINAEFKKHVSEADGVPYWEVKIGDYELNNGQPLYSEKEISVALWEFVNELKTKE